MGRVVHGGGIFRTAHEYGLGVMALASIAFVGVLLRRAPESAASPVVPPAAASEPR